MAAVALLLAVPAVVMESQDPVAPDSHAVPAVLDRFLDRVNAIAAPRARILAAGAPPALVFYRATSALYPREVYSAFAVDFERSLSAPPVGWNDLVREARHDGARYVLLWRLPAPARQALAPTVRRVVVRLHAGDGLLVEVAP